MNSDDQRDQKGGDQAAGQPGLAISNVALAYNHLSFAISRGTFNDRGLDELKSVVDNTIALRNALPPQVVESLNRAR